jgi:Rieske Fe-S protein
MAICEVCGNDYDKAIEVTAAGQTHVFDSFECAIHSLAPRCAHCGCTVIGHGLEADGRFFCCAHCASREGVGRLADRVDTAAPA